MKVINSSYHYNFNVGFEIDLVRYIMHYLESIIYLLLITIIYK